MKHGKKFVLAVLAAAGLLDGTTRLTSGGAPLHQMACLGTFGEQAIVPEISAVKIPDDVPLDVAALIGCGVLTGVGAALNTADIHEGDTVAVIGCGGVGLNVIQGAKIAGAGKIVAIDLFDSKLEMAREFGATHTINPGETEPVSAIAALNDGRGADVAFEVIGLGATIDQALNAAFTFLYLAKTVKGCWYGSSDVRTDVPKLLDLWQRGELKLEELISKEIAVDQVNEAFADMLAGTVARSVIRHAPEA